MTGNHTSLSEMISAADLNVGHHSFPGWQLSNQSVENLRIRWYQSFRWNHHIAQFITKTKWSAKCNVKKIYFAAGRIIVPLWAPIRGWITFDQITCSAWYFSSFFFISLILSALSAKENSSRKVRENKGGDDLIMQRPHSEWFQNETSTCHVSMVLHFLIYHIDCYHHTSFTSIETKS